jgi:hypothetical protein
MRCFFPGSKVNSEYSPLPLNLFFPLMRPLFAGDGGPGILSEKNCAKAVR